jgi:hypothetical protein
MTIDPKLSLAFFACRQDARLIKYMHFDREAYRPLILSLVASEKTDDARLSLWATALWTTVTVSVPWWDKIRTIENLFASCDDIHISEYESTPYEHSRAVHAHMLRLARKRKFTDLSTTNSANDESRNTTQDHAPTFQASTMCPTSLREVSSDTLDTSAR